jgi:hypothetical protein
VFFFARDGCLSRKHASFMVSWLGFARGGGVRKNLLYRGLSLWTGFGGGVGFFSGGVAACRGT